MVMNAKSAMNDAATCARRARQRMNRRVALTMATPLIGLLAVACGMSNIQEFDRDDAVSVLSILAEDLAGEASGWAVDSAAVLQTFVSSGERLLGEDDLRGVFGEGVEFGSRSERTECSFGGCWIRGDRQHITVTSFVPDSIGVRVGLEITNTVQGPPGTDHGALVVTSNLEFRRQGDAWRLAN
jgi:hypothetical protein